MKIIILGNGGTGKSTLGKTLSDALAIPVTHLDQLAWKPGWVRGDEKEFRARLCHILAGDSWIVEGWSYQSTLTMRLEAADIIVHLDYPIWFSYWNAFKRHVKYAWHQNPFDPPNSPILKKTRRMVVAMWRVYKQYEPEFRQMIPCYRNTKTIYIFKSRKELNAFTREFIQQNSADRTAF